MKTHVSMSEVDAGIPENAVSLYGSTDAMDDFPVLKAFQQYIDAEQAKSRKRLMVLCVFFGALMFIVVAVFVALLLNANSRNQSLNDRLVDYAMRDRERLQSMPTAAVQDNSNVIALTAKIEELQKKIVEGQAKAEQLVAEASEQAKKAAIEAAKPKEPSMEELEISRLKALLAIEKEKHSAEQEKRRQEELEIYRRKHYPELYEKTKSQDTSPKKPIAKEKENDKSSAHEDLLKEVDRILEDGEAIRYYDDDDVDVEKRSSPPSRIAPAVPQKEYSIPVDVRGSSNHWNVPNE